MLVIRAVKTDDLDALIEMARQAGSGMTTLKPDRKMLGDRVATAVASFNQAIPPDGVKDGDLLLFRMTPPVALRP